MSHLGIVSGLLCGGCTEYFWTTLSGTALFLALLLGLVKIFLDQCIVAFVLLMPCCTVCLYFVLSLFLSSCHAVSVSRHGVSVSCSAGRSSVYW